MLRALALLFTLLIPVSAHAQGTMTKRESRHPFDATVERLVKAVEAKGLKIAARVDHAAAAKAAGLALGPTTVVMFGNPKLGTPLMALDPRIGLDLPMRMLVWQDTAGKVWIGYTPPATLQASYRLAGKPAETILQTMAGALDAFAKAAGDAP